jgi:hypothetical protein
MQDNLLNYLPYIGVMLGVVLCLLFGIYLYHVIQAKFYHSSPSSALPHSDSQFDSDSLLNPVSPLPTAAKSPSSHYLSVMHFQRIKFLTDKIELIYEGFEQDHTRLKDLLAFGLTGGLTKQVTYDFKVRSKFKLYCPDISNEQFELFIRARTDMLAFINQLSSINKSRSHSSLSRMENSAELHPGQERLTAYQHELYAIQDVLEGKMQTLLSHITDSKD